MAAQGFVLAGTKMTSDQVVYSASQGAVGPGSYFAFIGSTAAAKYRRNEIITTWELCRDRLMKVMTASANLLTTGQQLRCSVALPNVKNYTIVKEAAATAPGSTLIAVGFTFIAPEFTVGVPPDDITYQQQGRPQQMGTVGLDAAVSEIIHAYLRMNSKD